MKINLTEFRQSDLNGLDTWCRDIQAHQFMSNVFPKVFERGDSVKNKLWKWYAIHKGNESIGTVWLEKENLDSETATLGILLGSVKIFNQGIGRRAIKLAIEKSCESLEYKTVWLYVRKSNKRAISCYKHCGFKISSEGVKINDRSEEIHYYIMERIG